METKKFIQEKLNEEFNPQKRMSMVKSVMNKCANHLFDAYRELDLAIQYCEDPFVREKLESIRKMLGNDYELSRFSKGDTPSVITDLQDLSNRIDPTL